MFLRRISPSDAFLAPWVFWGIIAMVLALALLLGGCAGTVARAIETGATVSEAAQQHIEDNLERRKRARDACWEMVEERTAKLRAEGKYEEAEALYRERYPSLLTERLITKALDSAEAGEPVKLPPDECGPE